MVIQIIKMECKKTKGSLLFLTTYHPIFLFWSWHKCNHLSIPYFPDTAFPIFFKTFPFSRCRDGNPLDLRNLRKFSRDSLPEDLA